jgi:hypothetical protein
VSDTLKALQSGQEDAEMALTINDEHLARRLRELAEREGRTIEALLGDLIDQHQASQPVDAEAQVRAVRRKAYERARRYWREAGDEARLALTDEQLDEQFWLFDSEDIPRLKEDEGKFELRNDSVRALGEALEQAGFRSGRTDTAERAKEIMNREYVDYILRRREQPDAE